MQITDTATFCATLVDEWVRSGVTAAFIAPGSRSTPLALALAERDEIAVSIFHDERSAGFAALGHGLITGHPAVALCTSGTAAAHFHAAVIEADLSGVPLLVCTANRPPELWDIAAPQTIDQTHLYGRAPRWFAQPGPPDAAFASTWRSLARRAVAEAIGWHGRPGPVHLDLSFRDPLAGRPGPLPESSAQTRTPIVTRPHVDDSVVDQLAAQLCAVDPERAGVIVASGAVADPEHIIALSRRLGWPLIADHRSGARIEGEAIHYSDALLRVPAFTDSLRPAAVIRIGEPLSSKITEQWLATVDGPTYAITDGRWIDPERVADAVIADQHLPARLLDSRHFTPALPDGPTVRELWLAADGAAGVAIDQILAEHPSSEPAVARAALNALPEGGALVMSSSMPVRDVEWYGPSRADIEVCSNRGANGIDGVVATAIGIALTGRSTICLIGDVALVHDSSSLTALAHRDINLTIVVTDNDGGAIFSFLPQHALLDSDRFEQLFGTPHSTDLLALAHAHHLETHDWSPSGDPLDQLALAPDRVRMIRVRSDRTTNQHIHHLLNTTVAQALGQDDELLSSEPEAHPIPPSR